MKFNMSENVAKITRFCGFNFIAVVAVMAVSGCAYLGPTEASTSNITVEQPAMTIHSAAGPKILLWTMNEEVGEQLAACQVGAQVEVVPSALPESINEVGQWLNRQVHYPMVTPVDFEPAVAGDGPVAWHDYPEPHADLKFIASLYEVGFGVLVFDDRIQTAEDLRGKRIAVARRPSSLRVLAEALLRDGWGVLDDVTLIDMPPHGVAAAVAAGQVDATTWSLMLETPEGAQALDPALLSLGHWIPVTEEDIQRINAKSGFRTSIATIDHIVGNPDDRVGESVNLVSFDQGLAGWSSSDDEQVTAILECLSAPQGDHASRLEAMYDWPGLSEDILHPAAMRFYQKSVPDFLKVDAE